MRPFQYAWRCSATKYKNKSMQPLQCVCNSTSQTRISAQQGNIHAAIPRRSATQNSRIRIELRTKYIRRTIHCRTPKRNPLHVGSSAPAPVAHPRYPFIAGRSHFTRKNTRFRAQTTSQNEGHATSMQPLQCVLQPQVANPHLDAHGNTTWHHSCSHSTAICNPDSQQTQRPTYIRRAIHSRPQRRNRFVARPRYLSLLAAATLHGKTQGFVPELTSEKEAHATSMQPVQCVLQPQVIHPSSSATHIPALHPVHCTSQSTLHPPFIKCNAHRTAPFIHPASSATHIAHHPFIKCNAHRTATFIHLQLKCNAHRTPPIDKSHP